MPLRLLRPEPPTPPPATLLPLSSNPSPPQPPPAATSNANPSIPLSTPTSPLPLSPPPSVVNSSEILVELERNNNSANSRQKDGPSGGDSEPNLIDCLLVSPAMNTLSIQLPVQADRVLGCFALILKMLWVYTQVVPKVLLLQSCVLNTETSIFLLFYLSVCLLEVNLFVELIRFMGKNTDANNRKRNKDNCPGQ